MIKKKVELIELNPGSVIKFKFDETEHEKVVQKYNKETGYIFFEDNTGFFGPSLEIDWSQSRLVKNEKEDSNN